MELLFFFTAVLMESQIAKGLENVVSDDAEVMYLCQGNART